MRVAVAGGGPGGLFFATLIRRADPSIEVTVFERNRADDTFGFGVVFSDRTLAGIHEADPVLREALTEHGRHWDEIEVRLKGRAHPLRRQRDGGRRATHLAGVMQAAPATSAPTCASRRRSRSTTWPATTWSSPRTAQARSSARARRDLGRLVEVETATAKFIWFGTDYLFDGLTFVHERSRTASSRCTATRSPTSVDVHRRDRRGSWRRAGLDEFDVTQPPGPSDLVTKDYLEKLFADQIDGKRLLTTTPVGQLPYAAHQRWHTVAPQPVAFLGDAVHTAHFSVGSGTKMAMEDAVALSAALAAHPGDLASALAAYEEAAQPSVRKIQDSARPSLSGGSTSAGITTPSSLGSSPTTSCPAASATRARRRALIRGCEPPGLGGHLRRRAAPDAFQRRGWSAPAVWSRFARTEAGRSPSPGRVAPSRRSATGPLGCGAGGPDSETGLPCRRTARRARPAGHPAGARRRARRHHLTRMLVCEQIRLHERLPALLIDPDAADDAPTRDRR
jgi:anthraniloyl-CoA monooxygenase